MNKKKKLAIRYLTLGFRDTQVAKKIGVSRMTVYRWLADPEFNAEWEKYDRAFMDSMDAEIKGIAKEAVSVLRKMLHSPNSAERRFAVDKALSLKRDYRAAKASHQDVTIKHEHFGNIQQSHTGTVEVKKLSREARKGLQAFLDETRDVFLSDN